MQSRWKENEFGSILQFYRTWRGLTQQQLADLSVLSVRALRDLEHGRAKRPRRETVRLLADALRLDTERREVFEQAARPTPVGGAELSGIPFMGDVYEYATVPLESPTAEYPQGGWAEALNDLAKQSWRLVTVDRGVAFLERQLCPRADA
ncbi:helix-turn-helix domain-containing protein [Streptomyces sp. NPDC087300]|uniref:helix-turn-helix domain-containing protein n=1 Tax=Streptomyces sp. NPDC087300 TaxID=3365780 RepID=UPI00381E2A69